MYNILICDDDKDIVNALKIYLQNPDYRLFEAHNGVEAVEMTQKEEFHLILLDIMLPNINGYELMDYIKEYNTPVIFVTAKAAVEDKVKGLKLGADDYIVKPFDLNELLARIETVLRRYGKTGRIPAQTLH